MRLYADIMKIDEEQKLVFGYASTESLDSQGEVVKRAAIEAALPEYLEIGNLREMHTMSAVGVTKSANMDDKGLYISAKVVDPNAWEKVKEGVYKGFSIGGRATARDPANRSHITGLTLTEISLVDRPANPDARIDLYKLDNGNTDDVVVEDPEAEEKPIDETAKAAETAATETPATVEKGMYGVGALADALQSIAMIQSDAAWESEWEGDGSNVPAALKEWLQMGTKILGAMVVEESEEIVAAAPDSNAQVEVLALADGQADIEKAGARNSKADKKHIQDAHDAMVGLGADCSSSKGDHSADVSKMVDQLDGLQKSYDDLTKAHDLLKAENEKLKAEPAPIKGVVTAVSKEADNTTKSEPEPEPANAVEAIKKAQAHPVDFRKL